MIRLWYRDGSYMDVTASEAVHYESDPEWDHSEDLNVEENGKRIEDDDDTK